MRKKKKVTQHRARSARLVRLQQLIDALIDARVEVQAALVRAIIHIEENDFYVSGKSLRLLRAALIAADKAVR